LALLHVLVLFVWFMRTSPGPITHIAFGAAFGGAGYLVYHWEEQQAWLIQRKHHEIAKRRESSVFATDETAEV
jgi:hypothetical protein